MTTNNGVKVPDGLREFLSNFTYHILKEQPADLNNFAFSYFAKKATDHQEKEENEENDDVEEEKSGSDSSGESSDFEEQRQSIIQTRRRGVAAESFDPESEAARQYTRVVHEKTIDQLHRLEGTLKPNLIFRSLDEEQIREVMDAMYERHVEAGEVIIRQGEDGDNFYVIESGTYDVFIQDQRTKQDKKVNIFQDKGAFGELALMYNCPRAATVIATTSGVIWVMDRDTFRSIILLRAFQKRQYFEKLLESVPILQQMSPYERMNVADALKSKIFKQGEKIISQGEEGRSMFFVESGEVRVLMKRNKSANHRQVNILSSGDYFGELALLSKQPRVASIIAHSSECRVAELDIDGFERLLGPCEQIMKRNISKYEEQLTATFGSLDDLPTGFLEKN